MTPAALHPFRRPNGIGFRTWRKLWHIGHHRRPWSWVAEPRWVSVLVTIAYANAVGLGLVAAWRPPLVVELEIGPAWTTSWAIGFAVGGALAGAGALPGFRYLERAGLMIIMSACGIYASLVARQGMLISGGLAIILAIVLAARTARIWGTTLDPSRGPVRRKPPDSEGDAWTPKSSSL